MLRFDAVPEPVKALLLKLAPSEALADFALGGGTSLALRFGHRISIDLDFFTVREFSADELADSLGLEGHTVIGRAKNSLTLDSGGVKIDLLRHAYRALAPVDEIDGVHLLSLPDVVAMKLNAIANRGSKKDFYDFAELLGHYPIGKMVEFFMEKYPNTDPFTVIRSLSWFEDAEMEPEPVSMSGQSWSGIKRVVAQAVAELR